MSRVQMVIKAVKEDAAVSKYWLK